jgi:hypothetical protein
MLNETLQQTKREDMLARYHAHEMAFNYRVDQLGLEFSSLLNKDLFDSTLSKYCKRFIQAGSDSMSVRFMIPSEFGLPAIIKEKMEQVFNEMFPGNAFK